MLENSTFFRNNVYLFLKNYNLIKDILNARNESVNHTGIILNVLIKLSI